MKNDKLQRLTSDREKGLIRLDTPNDDVEYFAENASSYAQEMAVSKALSQYKFLLSTYL